MQENTPQVRKPASHVILSRMHLTLHVTRREHLTALRAWCTRCSPGRRKPGVLRPGIVEVRGSYHHGHITVIYGPKDYDYA